MGSDYTGLVRCAGAGGCCWSGVREKHCWLVGGWRLLMEWCERKTLLDGAGAKQHSMVLVVYVTILETSIKNTQLGLGLEHD